MPDTAGQPTRADEARALRNTGKPVTEIAAQFGVHPATVYDWLKRGERGEKGEVAAGLDKLLDGLELDDLGRFKAALARNLAAKLDEAKNSPIAAVAMAVPSTAKELRAVVAEIVGTSADDEEWLVDVFAPVGDSANTRPQDTRGPSSQDR